MHWSARSSSYICLLTIKQRVLKWQRQRAAWCSCIELSHVMTKSSKIKEHDTCHLFTHVLTNKKTKKQLFLTDRALFQMHFGDDIFSSFRKYLSATQKKQNMMIYGSYAHVMHYYMNHYNCVLLSLSVQWDHIRDEMYQSASPHLRSLYLMSLHISIYQLKIM